MDVLLSYVNTGFLAIRGVEEFYRIVEFAFYGCSSDFANRTFRKLIGMFIDTVVENLGHFVEGKCEPPEFFLHSCFPLAL